MLHAKPSLFLDPVYGANFLSINNLKRARCTTFYFNQFGLSYMKSYPRLFKDDAN